MNETVKTRQVNDVMVIDLKGRIVRGDSSLALRDAVRDLVGKGNTKILLNLGGVSYLDSPGIGELFAAFASVANQGGQLKMLNPTERVKDLLQVTKLYEVFDVHDNEANALRSFSSAAATA
ncbi:MAG TPA: STAS domain-containing protein [Bryobacteraceae bacterium]|nr:STAS domain-containing protein [Bryobacteraceae bacterium]